jgi:hypothetical protein
MQPAAPPVALFNIERDIPNNAESAVRILEEALQ